LLISAYCESFELLLPEVVLKHNGNFAVHVSAAELQVKKSTRLDETT
jgi:hypothetical protein